MSSKTKTNQKPPAKRQPSATISSTYYTPPPRDDYTTPKDSIWGDVIKHERVLENIWKESWEDTIVPKEMRQENKKNLNKGKNLSSYGLQPSPSVPATASSIVGWRSSVPSNSLDFFNVKYVSNKKRFVWEQYGYYRTSKYLQKESQSLPDENNVRNEKHEEKYIKHRVKPLLC